MKNKFWIRLAQISAFIMLLVSLVFLSVSMVIYAKGFTFPFKTDVLAIASAIGSLTSSIVVAVMTLLLKVADKLDKLDESIDSYCEARDRLLKKIESL